MKKIKYLLAFLALLPFSRAIAQQGEIIYVDFDPDWIGDQSWYDTLWIDFDADGERDLLFYWNLNSISSEPYFHTTDINWTIHAMAGADTLLPLSEIEDYWLTSLWFERPTPYYPAPVLKYAIRHQVGNDYYYGWYKVLSVGTVSFDMYAFCTIPNYPLRWGQTGITGVEENESIAFATVHPNPTTGMFSITGENLRKAEVTNMLGQHVATASGQGEQLTVDISRLPAGVYFVSVTDESGKKCVRKVVKK